jgi:hypothetical protein
MSSITPVAKKFFEACEAGKGWAVCKEWCTPNATFSAQAEPLADVRNLQQYTDWMKGLLTFIPDGRYELKSFATDEERKNVSGGSERHADALGQRCGFRNLVDSGLRYLTTDVFGSA